MVFIRHMFIYKVYRFCAGLARLFTYRIRCIFGVCANMFRPEHSAEPDDTAEPFPPHIRGGLSRALSGRRNRCNHHQTPHIPRHRTRPGPYHGVAIGAFGFIITARRQHIRRQRDARTKNGNNRDKEYLFHNNLPFVAFPLWPQSVLQIT